MILIFYIFLISCMAQSTTISGALEVSDAIASIGTVNTNLINNAIYNQDGLTIWQVTPNANYTYINDLKFYAKLDKNNNILSVLLSSGEEYASLRGMIPSLYGDENYALSTTPDEFHKCYEYTNSKTLIYEILEDTFDELKAKSVISVGATLSGNPSYECSFLDKLHVLGYYIAAAEYDNNYNSFHNWPWGRGTDICRYHPEFHGCEYSDGWANVDLNLDIKNIRNYYIYGGVYNDNSEESRISLDSTPWLQQINWGGKGDIKSGKNNIPSKITLYGRKTWSVTSAMIWMAIDADSVSAAGHIKGEGSSKIDSSENPDVLETIALKKGPIEWPTVPASRNPPLLINAKVTPECGKENDQYTFSVIYKDEGGAEPTTANIWIKGFDFDSPRGIYDSGYYNKMEKISGDITQGATYSYSTQLPTNGEYHYAIYFVNDKGNRVDLPQHGFSDNLGLSGPYVGKECDSFEIPPYTPPVALICGIFTRSSVLTIGNINYIELKFDETTASSYNLYIPNGEIIEANSLDTNEFNIATDTAEFSWDLLNAAKVIASKFPLSTVTTGTKILFNDKHNIGLSTNKINLIAFTGDIGGAKVTLYDPSCLDPRVIPLDKGSQSSYSLDMDPMTVANPIVLKWDDGTEYSNGCISTSPVISAGDKDYFELRVQDGCPDQNILVKSKSGSKVSIKEVRIPTDYVRDILDAAFGDVASALYPPSELLFLGLSVLELGVDIANLQETSSDAVTREGFSLWGSNAYEGHTYLVSLDGSDSDVEVLVEKPSELTPPTSLNDESVWRELP